jgi:CheY-like chemotaxis protein
VEDNEQQGITTARLLERRPVRTPDEHASVDRVTNFDQALSEIENHRYDLIILDIRDQGIAEQEYPSDQADSGDEATTADKGLELYSEIRHRRFLPIVFYSAVAHLAAHLDDPPFVTVVSKLADVDNLLRQRIATIFDSGLPLLNRALTVHVDDVLRDFMIDFVEKHWSDLSGYERRGDLAYLMVRQLARALDSTFVAELAEAVAAPSNATVHPTRFYVVPPLHDPRTGDLVRNNAGEWFIVITPTCDLVAHSGRRRAEYVIVAPCVLLTDTEEYLNWVSDQTSAATKKLDLLITNRRQGQLDRYYFLPSAWGVPDLVVDLQRLTNFSYADFDSFTRVATLDDPYAQAVLAQLGRYGGRVGTPDLDASAVKQRLLPISADVEEIADPSQEQSTSPS